MKLALALVLLVACDRVYGLTGRGDDTVDPGDAIHVDGTLARTTVYNDTNHLPLVVTTLPADADRPIVTAFGEDVPVAWNPVDGTFSFDAPTPYEVRIGAFEWQSSEPALALDLLQFGRPSAPASVDANLDITMQPPPTGGKVYALFSTGVWSRRSFTPPASGIFRVEWEDADFNGFGPHLLDTTAGDTLLLATYGLTSNPGELVLAELATVDPLTMTEGAQSLTLSSTFVTGAQCAMVVPSADRDIARLRGLFPAYTASSFGGWEIDASPFAEMFGVRIPMMLRSRYTPDGDREAQTLAFANPFIGNSIVAMQSSSVSRTLAGGYVVYASIAFQKLVAPTGTGCERIDTGSDEIIAMPAQPELARVRLATDGLAIAAPDRAFVDLTWTTLGDVMPDVYTVDIIKITGATGEVVRTMLTREPRARITTSLFEPGELYIFGISSRTGVPNAAVGDFTHLTLPSWVSASYSSSFTLVQ